MDTLERFPRVWCDTCRNIQRMIFDVMKANDNDHDSADVICAECRSVIATLHAPSAKRVARMSASNSSIAIFNTSQRASRPLPFPSRHGDMRFTSHTVCQIPSTCTD